MNADEPDARGQQADATTSETAETAAPDATPDPEKTEPAAPAPRRRRLLRRALISAGVLVLVLVVLIGGGIWFVTARYAGNIDRISDVFGGISEETRPAPATSADDPSGDPVTFLLVGSDTRGHPASGEDPDGRSDAIMIARLSADRKHAQLISIPRDSWVPIPGHGTSKINAAYSWGGPSLLIQTVEQLTKVRIDHYVAIDFDGIAQVTDALGGVDVKVAETTTNGPYTFTAGVNHITGEQARWYLGQRHRLAGGDFDRVKRQQQYLQAVFKKLFSSDTFKDVGKLDSSLRALTSAVSIDDTLSSTDLFTLAYSMRDLTPQDVDFFTAPVLGTGMEGAASVVYLDQTKGQRMWAYLNSDSLAQNAAEFSKEALPDTPR
ncbi:LCP family protein [Petropleomorpha daqingensis]|uniref:LCP family protein required for cell wall assembly n=1 Tax=Petropleomorpha daqingensis TaxID=2026353 RepID=A0A853CEN8_9ACTN|nr:LCP family protein [Petropleomorpha daqingensis]NYJ05867.1 LCP family protein required for cell wall assembly [Petropleomorpha daqingensis]